MNWPLCSCAISRMGCRWLGGMLWQWDLAVALLGPKEVIRHSAQRRSPNPLHPPRGCRHLVLLGYLPGEGSQTYPAIHVQMLPEMSVMLWLCVKDGIPQFCSPAECVPEALGAGMKDSVFTASCELSNYPRTSFGFLRCLQMPLGQEFLLVTPRNELLCIKAVEQSQTTALLSHFVATTIWYEWGFFLFFFSPIKNGAYFKTTNSG